MLRKAISVSIIVAFLFTLYIPVPKAQASVMGLPEPGTMVNLSPSFAPAMIKGLTVHKDNPFRLDFILDLGDETSSEAKRENLLAKEDYLKLIKYFMAALAIPEKDLWVNLSPYEKDRTVPEALGQTDMGRDLLAQDYILKQLTASLIYPEKEIGQKFWDRVYKQAQEKFGTANIPVNTFNKVWIMADKAEVFERNQTAFVVNCHLKVMLEQDYKALSHQTSHPERSEGSKTRSFVAKDAPQDDARNITNQIVRQILIPEIEKEVNLGKNFASLRQIFNSIILASWYKNNLKQALLNQVYTDKSKVNGIMSSPNASVGDPELIYQQYLAAYKKGVFNYIKEAPVAGTPKTGAPKKYFSGGVVIGAAVNPLKTNNVSGLDKAMGAAVGGGRLRAISVRLQASAKDIARRAMRPALKAHAHFENAGRIWGTDDASGIFNSKIDALSSRNPEYVRMIVDEFIESIQRGGYSDYKSPTYIALVTRLDLLDRNIKFKKDKVAVDPQYKRTVRNLKILIKAIELMYPGIDGHFSHPRFGDMPEPETSLGNAWKQATKELFPDAAMTTDQEVPVHVRALTEGIKAGRFEPAEVNQGQLDLLKYYENHPVPEFVVWYLYEAVKSPGLTGSKASNILEAVYKGLNKNDRLYLQSVRDRNGMPVQVRLTQWDMSPSGTNTLIKDAAMAVNTEMLAPEIEHFAAQLSKLKSGDTAKIDLVPAANIFDLPDWIVNSPNYKTVLFTGISQHYLIVAYLGYSIEGVRIIIDGQERILGFDLIERIARTDGAMTADLANARAILDEAMQSYPLRLAGMDMVKESRGNVLKIAALRPDHLQLDEAMLGEVYNNLYDLSQQYPLEMAAFSFVMALAHAHALKTIKDRWRIIEPRFNKDVANLRTLEGYIRDVDLTDMYSFYNRRSYRFAYPNFIVLNGKQRRVLYSAITNRMSDDQIKQLFETKERTVFQNALLDFFIYRNLPAFALDENGRWQHSSSERSIAQKGIIKRIRAFGNSRLNKAEVDKISKNIMNDLGDSSSLQMDAIIEQALRNLGGGDSNRVLIWQRLIPIQKANELRWRFKQDGVVLPAGVALDFISGDIMYSIKEYASTVKTLLEAIVQKVQQHRAADLWKSARGKPDMLIPEEMAELATGGGTSAADYRNAMINKIIEGTPASWGLRYYPKGRHFIIPQREGGFGYRISALEDIQEYVSKLNDIIVTISKEKDDNLSLYDQLKFANKRVIEHKGQLDQEKGQIGIYLVHFQVKPQLEQTVRSIVTQLFGKEVDNDDFSRLNRPQAYYGRQFDQIFGDLRVIQREQNISDQFRKQQIWHLVYQMHLVSQWGASAIREPMSVTDVKGLLGNDEAPTLPMDVLTTEKRRQKTVVVVWPSRNGRNESVNALIRAGYHVEVFENESDAANYLKQEKPVDAVLMDDAGLKTIKGEQLVQKIVSSIPLLFRMKLEDKDRDFWLNQMKRVETQWSDLNQHVNHLVLEIDHLLIKDRNQDKAMRAQDFRLADQATVALSLSQVQRTLDVVSVPGVTGWKLTEVDQAMIENPGTYLALGIGGAVIIWLMYSMNKGQVPEDRLDVLMRQLGKPKKQIESLINLMHHLWDHPEDADRMREMLSGILINLKESDDVDVAEAASELYETLNDQAMAVGSEESKRAARAKKRVLVVDDEANEVKKVSDALESLGYQVITFANGLEAFNALIESTMPGKKKEDRIDFVITDNNMPLMNGAELLKQMPSYPKLSYLKFILRTNEVGFIKPEQFDAKLGVVIMGKLKSEYPMVDLTNKVDELLRIGQKREYVLKKDSDSAQVVAMLDEAMRAQGLHFADQASVDGARIYTQRIISRLNLTNDKAMILSYSNLALIGIVGIVAALVYYIPIWKQKRFYSQLAWNVNLGAMRVDLMGANTQQPMIKGKKITLLLEGYGRRPYAIVKILEKSTPTELRQMFRLNIDVYVQRVGGPFEKLKRDEEISSGSYVALSFRDYHDREVFKVKMASPILEGDYVDVTGRDISKIDVDAAMLQQNSGGIDLKDSGVNTKVTKEANGVDMTMDPAMVERIKREGVDFLTPVILNITPIVSIWPLLGMEPPKRPDELVKV